MGCSMAKRKPNKAQKDFIRRHPIIAILLVIAIALGTYFLKPWEYIDSGKNPSDTPVDVSEAEGKLQVHYIDVGQADSILIKLPTGENILIDAGASNDSDVRKTKGRVILDVVVLGYFRRLPKPNGLKKATLWLPSVAHSRIASNTFLKLFFVASETQE